MSNLRIVGVVVGTVIGLMVLVTALGIVGNLLGFVRWQTDPQVAMPRYEYFFNLCGQVQSAESTIERLESEREATNDPNQQDRLAGAIAANQAQRDRAIDRYNATAASYTRGMFQSANLPDRLDKEGTTQCES